MRGIRGRKETKKHSGARGLRRYAPAAAVLLLAVLPLTGCAGMDRIQELMNTTAESEAPEELQEALPLSQSRTAAILHTMTDETGRHMRCSLQENGERVEREIFEKGDDLCADITAGGKRTILLSDAAHVAELDPETLTYTLGTPDEADKTRIEEMRRCLHMADVVLQQPEATFIEGRLKIGEDLFLTEEFETAEGAMTFAYDSGDFMRAIITGYGDDQKVLMVHAFDTEIPDGRFLIPETYTNTGTENAAEAVEEVVEETTEGGDLEGFRIFASEKEGFSFLYEEAHTAYITESGSAELAIGGDDSLAGLTVSVEEANEEKTADAILSGETERLQQEYADALTEQPEPIEETIEGHTVKGILYAYTNEAGKTIDAGFFVETRDGRNILYRTQAQQGGSGPELEAMGTALASLQLDAKYYGESDAAEGSLS